jgi:threonine dehydrogenase-like Zn-dependent dehydrogenase
LQLGLPPAGSLLALPGDLLVNNDLTLAASFGYTSAAWSRVVDLLNEGAFRPGRIVTHTFGLDEYERAFAELAEPTERRGKILLEVAGG